MDNVDVNKDHVERRNSQIAEANMPKEHFSTNRALHCVPSTSNADESICTSPVLNTGIIRRRGILRLSGKSVSSKNDGDNGNMLERLQTSKRLSSENPTGSVSDLNDAKIPIEAFSESIRALENACKAAKTVQPVAPPNRLGLVSFSSLINCNVEDQNVQKNCPSFPHLSFDEDKEEDMFADENENEEDVAEFSTWNYKSAESPTSFYGFSSNESVHSTDVATQCNLRRKLEESEDKKDEEENFFHGFSSADASKAAVIERIWSCKLKKYYPDSELKKSWSNLKNVGSSVDNEKEIITKKLNDKDQAISSTSKRIVEKSPDEGKVENFVDSQNSSKFGIFMDGGSVSPVKKSDKVTLEAAIAENRDLSSRNIESTKKKLELNNCKLKDPQAIFAISKVSYSQNRCGFTMASGRPISISEKALEKAHARFCDEIDSTMNEKLEDIKIKEICESNSRLKCIKSEKKFDLPTSGVRSINISEKSSDQAKIVADEIDATIDEKWDDFEIDQISTSTKQDDLKIENFPQSKYRSKFSNISDKSSVATTDGRSINTSEKIIKKVKNILSDEIVPMMNENLDDFQMDDISKSANWSNFVPQNVCGFSTARGRSIVVSETAMAKAQKAYKELERLELENIEMVENPPKIAVKMEKKSEISLGFKTARGEQLKISKDALSNAQAQFEMIKDSVIDNMNDISSNLDSQKPTVSTFKNSTINCGFATANGCPIKVTERALASAQKNFAADFDDIEPLNIEDFVDPIEESEPLKNKNFANLVVPNDESELSKKRKSEDLTEEENDKSRNKKICNLMGLNEKREQSKKRKFEEVDEDTPLRRDPPWKRKNGRYVNDLQGRKLFDEDSGKTGSCIKDFKIVGSKDIEMTISPVGSNILDEPEIISQEIDASAAAFLEDEELSMQESKYCLSNDNKFIRTRSLPQVSSNLCQTVDRSKIKESSVFATKRSRSGPEKMEIYDNGSAYRNKNEEEENERKIEEERDKIEENEEKKETTEIQHESIPDDLTFDSQFSQEPHQPQIMNKFIMETMKIMEARLAMTSKQDEVIRAKRRTKPQAQDGSLYQLRISCKDSRISWKELTGEGAPEPREHSGKSLGSDPISISSTSAATYKFSCTDFYGGKNVRINVEGINVGDDAFLILDEKNCAGPREFERAFLASPGVDPNLVPTGWVKNHYRWIIWKLASMDRVKFGHKCLPRMLTPNRVMLELKYRYDREIYRLQWPPLRRILEKNEDSCSRMVLCVASIVEEDNKTPVKGSSTPNSLSSTIYKMKLTDGWYSIFASIDLAMVNCIKSGKVKEGTKLVTFGAKAIHLDQGCSALEIPDAVTLRIHTNSTRRIKWDAKLDFCHLNRGPMSLSLKSVKPNGGAICKMVVAVARVYPVLYREKLSDGQFVFRNERCDEEAARAHEAIYQSKIEEIYANASIDFQNCSQSREKEDEIRQCIASKLSQCLPPPRDVTPVMKIRIAEGDISAMMTVYSTDRETAQIFVEGSSIIVYNAFAAGQRSNELNVTAARSTFFKCEGSRRIVYPERTFTSLMDVGEAGFNPVYGEFDTVGIVASTGAAPHGMKNFETVNLACPRSDDESTSDFLSVLFWQGVSTHGYSKILTVGTLVACSNLEWRRNTSRSIPTAYCTERSIFTKNPRKNYLSQPFESLRDQIKDPLSYAASSAAIIQEEIAKKSALRTPGSGTSWRPGITSNNSTPGWSPRDVSSSNDGHCSTPVNVSRKSATMRRIEKLEVYGEPPKLPPIVINNSSPQVLSDFRPPVLTPVTRS